MKTLLIGKTTLKAGKFQCTARDFLRSPEFFTSNFTLLSILEKYLPQQINYELALKLIIKFRGRLLRCI